MQFGIVSTALGPVDLPEAFALAARAGAEGVEIFYYNRDAAKWLDEETHPDWLKKLQAEHSVKVPSLCLGVLGNDAPLMGDEDQRKRGIRYIRRAIDVAIEVGADVLLLPFFGKNAIELESELIKAGEELAELVEPAEQAGIVLAIESQLNVSQQRFLLDHLGRTPNVKIYVDTGNDLARKRDPATGIRDLGGGDIAQVHFKDVRMVEGQPPDFNVALGEGDVDFRAVAQALRAVGYDGWCVLEAPGGKDPLATAKQNFAFARAAFTPTP